MKKYLFIISFCFLVNGGLLAQQLGKSLSSAFTDGLENSVKSLTQQNPKSWHQTGDVGDVMNAYQYDEICPYEYRKIIPFFRPSSKNYASCLIIDIYPTEKYYGEDVKASEYPLKTYKVYYNTYGCPYRLDDGLKVHLFKYDSNGILVSYSCYDKNTGKLINENTRRPPFNIKDQNDNNWTVIHNSSGEYWYIYEYHGEYVTSSTPFLDISYKDGFRVYYDLAFRCNHPGEKMLILKHGQYYVSPEWLRNHISKNWKKQGTRNMAYMVFSDASIDIRKTTNYHTYYNEVGLTGTESMTLGECLSHGVRDGKWYDYQWVEKIVD